MHQLITKLRNPSLVHGLKGGEDHSSHMFSQ